MDLANLVTDGQKRAARDLGRKWADDHEESEGPAFAEIPHAEIQKIADSTAPEAPATTMGIQLLNREFTRAALVRLRDLADDPRAKKFFDRALGDGV